MSMEVTASISDTSKKSITYRNFNAVDVDEFKEDIRMSDIGNESKWRSCGLEETVLLYVTVLEKLMDKHCPLINKKVTDRDKPWEDDELRTLLRKRRAAENAWRKGNGLRETYVNLRKQFSMLEGEKRTVYYKNSLMRSSGDIKMLYKKLNRLLGNSAQNLPSSAIDNPEGLSEDFKDFFAKKVDDIRLDIEEELKTSVSSGRK